MDAQSFTLQDLRSDDAILRRRALGQLVRDADGSTPSPALLRACVCRLGDEERAVRRFSAESLSGWLENGTPATRREVRRRLKDALSHRNTRVAATAARVLTRVDGPRSRFAAPLLRALSLDDEEERREAAETLTKTAHVSRRLAARLRGLARRGSAVERRMALYCLRDLPKSASVGTEPFLQALSDPDPLVRSAAASTLGRIGRRSRLILDGLLRALKQDPSLLMRRVAAVALGQIAAPRRDVRASLEESMQADDPDLRRAARHALARLQPAPQRRRRRTSRSAPDGQQRQDARSRQG
ncbi:MAG: HEAT repeat domain-containing protein [Myxococcota bacterium]